MENPTKFTAIYVRVPVKFWGQRCSCLCHFCNEVSNGLPLVYRCSRYSIKIPKENNDLFRVAECLAEFGNK